MKAWHLVVVTTVLIAGQALAGLAPLPRKVDITRFTCGELLSLRDEERDRGLIYLQGYMDGRRGLTVFDQKTAADAMDKLLDYCHTNPSSAVLEALARISP